MALERSLQRGFLEVSACSHTRFMATNHSMMEEVWTVQVGSERALSGSGCVNMELRVVISDDDDDEDEI